jgi:hypothetical protein
MGRVFNLALAVLLMAATTALASDGGPPDDVPTLVWWMFGGVVAVCVALMRLATWLMSQRVDRIESDAVHAVAQARADASALEVRLRALENGSHLKGIESTLADVRERLVRIETQLEKQR